MLNFTLDQLVALDAIARGGSFAAAARELNKVPSAITYLKQELESSLGVELFERKGRGVVITPAGGRLLAAARDTLAQTRDRNASESALMLREVGPVFLERMLAREDV
jgi:DNA-binding transcriptional LysR family regulator